MACCAVKRITPKASLSQHKPRNFFIEFLLFAGMTACCVALLLAISVASVVSKSLAEKLSHIKASLRDEIAFRFQMFLVAPLLRENNVRCTIAARTFRLSPVVSGVLFKYFNLVFLAVLLGGAIILALFVRTIV